MSEFLTEMSQTSLRRARAAGAPPGPDRLQESVARLADPIPLRLSSEGFDLICETKLAGPSQGALVPGAPGDDQVVALARAFEAGGAIAISVLTEETRFAGSLRHQESVAAAVSVPVMRKDFLVDPIQVLEARARGASGVLLIARMLPGALLVEMTDLAIELGMFVVVEVFDTTDLANAARVFDRDVLVGVNCRDLATLEVDTGRFAQLAPHLPDHLPAIAESGIVTPADVAEVVDQGYRAALVGSSLVSSSDPAAALRRLLAAGRTATTGSGR